MSVEKNNKWSVKGVNLQTDSPKHSIAGSCLIQQWCKAWSSWNIRPRNQSVGRRGGGGGKETRLLGTGPPPGCSELALVSTWLCPLSATQRGRWMGVNWNQFLLSETINGVAQTGQGGGPTAGLWLLILPHKHARNVPPGICPVTIHVPPPALYTHGYIRKCLHRPINPPTGQNGWRGCGGHWWRSTV